jgi:hypothetical protein
MPENKVTDAADAPERTAAHNQGGIVTKDYEGPDRRAERAPEPKAWYQTIGNNLSQWLAIGGVLITCVTMYSEFKTKSAVRDALIDERFEQYKARDARIEESTRQAEQRRISEKQEFVNQINAVLGEMRGDIRAIRDRLDRGR